MQVICIAYHCAGSQAEQRPQKDHCPDHNPTHLPDFLGTQRADGVPGNERRGPSPFGLAPGQTVQTGQSTAWPSCPPISSLALSLAAAPSHSRSTIEQSQVNEFCRSCSRMRASALGRFGQVVKAPYHAVTHGGGGREGIGNGYPAVTLASHFFSLFYLLISYSYSSNRCAQVVPSTQVGLALLMPVVLIA